MHHAPLAKVTAPSQSAKQQLLVCFSHLRWNFVYQRPQHLLTRAARNHHVYFVEEPIFERGGTLPRLDLRPQPSGVMVAVPVLAEGSSEAEIVEAQRQLVDDLLAGRAEEHRTFWYYTPMAMAFTEHLEPDLCIYDCMDELSAFRFAPPALRTLEAKLLARADLVFTGGQSLYEAKRGRHPNIHAFPSSIDTAHFAKARRTGGRGPDDQAALPRPRLGFFGVIDERMDLDLVGRLAELRPDWQLVMVGPVVKIDPATLPRRPNVHWLGGKTYDELPAYLAGWDLGFMPFALNESTRYISPTKTPEFLAAGVPVVSTPITDVVRPYGEL
ncbi:MAG: glycosyltransferase, partial [Pseudomonadota bacterium]|nr:glycosyltransferase [Pseudomonadota bacterium]